MTRFQRFARVAVAVVIALVPAIAQACPFCTAQALTITEEIKAADVALLARLAANPAPATPSADPNAELERLPFEVVEVLKGEKHIAGQKTVKTLYFGQAPKGTMFLMFGYEPPKIGWSAPTALTERAIKYVHDIQKLPEKGADRLAYFQEYLEDKEEPLARDAYDEFAKAPYKEVVDLKSRMKHDKLVAWIKDPQTSIIHRRLYLTLLSVCGGKDDVPMLEAMIRSGDRGERRGLDALISCYLNLRGVEGLPLIEELFLKNAKADYSDTYSAIMSLRFQMEEIKGIPQEKALASLKLMLDRPNLADLVIPDLARWEDWASMPRLIDLFKNATEETSFVRVPVVNYLRACPKPEAKAAIEDLRKIDPSSVKQAETFFPFVGAPPKTDPATDAKAADKANGKDAKSDGKADATKAKAKEQRPEAPKTGEPAPATRKSAAAQASIPVAAIAGALMLWWRSRLTAGFNRRA